MSYMGFSADPSPVSVLNADMDSFFITFFKIFIFLSFFKKSTCNNYFTYNRQWMFNILKKLQNTSLTKSKPFSISEFFPSKAYLALFNGPVEV